MPRSKSVRDFDLYILQDVGEITENQVKVEGLRRDMKEMKREPFYIFSFVSLLIILGILSFEMRISIYILCGLEVYPVLMSIYSTWIKLAEMETDITYLEAGLELIRN